MKQRKLIAIVGRPNVGKSTLFNRLTKHWSAIVEDRPGITRDRLYGEFKISGHEVVLMDTGGLQVETDTVVEKKMSEQAWQGIEDADFILFVLDGRAGVTPLDRDWIQKVRKLKKPKLFVVNKLDEPKLDEKLQEFYELGVHPLIPLSAEKQRNFSGLHEELLNGLGLEPIDESENSLDVIEESNHTDFSICIAGRPNVGKSTLLNAFLDEERCIVDDVPGTTRDPIHSFVSYQDKTYKFIDTAGIRKRARTKERVEKFSVVQSLKVIDQADLSLLLIDGNVGPTEQDAHVAGYAFEKGKAIILVVNKWDEGKDKYTREEFEERLEFKMNYLNYCPVLYVSAKTGKNLDKIFKAIEFVREQYERKISTAQLNRAFEELIENHPLPVYKGQQIKMYYATQVSQKPPTFAVFCNYPKEVHFSYKRYLINSLRDRFDFQNVPVRVLFKKR